MDVESTKSAITFFKDLTSTKHGMYVTLVVLLTAAFLTVLWLVNGQRVTAIEERKEALQQLAESHKREARIKDECFESVQKMVSWAKELGALTSTNVKAVRDIEMQTNAAIAQQKEIIYKSMNDETN